jgi:cytochrome c biogenesis protein CcmG/thiol:disulfide interchange protein DsbE
MILRPLSAFVLSVVALAVPAGGCGTGSLKHPAVGLRVASLPVVPLQGSDTEPPRLAGRVTLVNFWGTWCPPCRQELPGLARLADRLADEPRFQLIAISCGNGGPDDLDELRTDTSRFLASRSLTLEPWADPDAEARLLFQASFGLEAFPTTYLIGPDASIRRVWVGFRERDEADIAQLIMTTLKESHGPPDSSAAAPAKP